MTTSKNLLILSRNTQFRALRFATFAVILLTGLSAFALQTNIYDGNQRGRTHDKTQNTGLRPTGSSETVPEIDTEPEQRLETKPKVIEGGLRIHGTPEYNAQVLALLKEISPYVGGRQMSIQSQTSNAGGFFQKILSYFRGAERKSNSQYTVVTMEVPQGDTIDNPVGTDLIRSLIEAKGVTTIKHTSVTNNAYAKGLVGGKYSPYAEVKINSHVRLKNYEYRGTNDVREFWAEPSIVLSHELTHARHYVTGTTNLNGVINQDTHECVRCRSYLGLNRGTYGNTPGEEIDTAGVEYGRLPYPSENSIRKEQGLYMRNHY